VAYLPGLQYEHAVLFLHLEKDPGKHFIQNEVPEIFEKCPLGHELHVMAFVMPNPVEYVP